MFRSFGVLASDTTPCGKPLSMAHAHALMVLLARGELAQQSLGAELRIDKSNVARLCAKMVHAKHVKQRSNDLDGRSRLVSLTPQGARLAQQVEAASSARFGALLGGVPELRRAEVIAALQHLVAALDALPVVPLEERTSA
jgi:DNA-binding MarR family transcriptional regulator